MHYLCSKTISHMNIQTLESNLFLILKRLHHFYHQMLPEHKSVEDRKDENLQLKYTIVIFDYSEIICSHIPRILYLLLYTNFNHFDRIIQLTLDFLKFVAKNHCKKFRCG